MKSRKKNKVSSNHPTITRRITRSVSLSNGRGNSLPIPIEILIMIFSRLSLKSIARCRCVSKLWASILRRSDFTELFLSMSCSRGLNLLFVCQKEGKLCLFSSPEPQNLDEDSSLVVSSHQMKFSFDGNFSLQSDLVHGVILLGEIRIVNETEILLQKICNPSTGKTLILPNVKSNRKIVWSLFGYDPIGKQFKVVSMTQHKGRVDVYEAEYHVLTLGTEIMSWRRIECDLPHHSPHQKICINGVLYYTSIDSDTKTCKVICFDVRSEKFSSIKLMGTVNEAFFGNGYVTLINYNGKLGLIQYQRFVFQSDRRSVSFKLWILEDHEKHKWSSEHTFVFSTTPKIIVRSVLLRFVGVTQKKEIVLSSSYVSAPFYLFYLNLEKNTIRRVTIQGIDMCRYGIEHIFLDHIENVKLF